MDEIEIKWMKPEETKLGRWQKTIKDRSGSSTFCALPWIHFATRPNGDMRLCCSANASGAGIDNTIGLVKNENGIPANFGTDTPMSAWNNDYMKNVRKIMLSGEIPSSCTKCFEEESKGVVSKRIWETGSWMEQGLDIQELIDSTSDDGRIPEKLVYLDLRLGHTCNLKCVMCSPHDSSKWVSDHKKLFPSLQSQVIKSQISWKRKEFNNFKEYNPFKLYRSAGFGLRVFMPAFGLLGIDFGHGFDALPGQSTKNGWETHFIIGQQF
jgi:hypothetical protein